MIAWTFEDLKGIPVSIAEHDFEFKLNAIPTQQRKYHMNPNYVREVVKLDKLMVAKFISLIDVEP